MSHTEAVDSFPTMPRVDIPPLDHEAMAAAIARQAHLTKPPGALGHLETMATRLVGMTGRLDWLPARRLVVVCAGDHGVSIHGVSAYPSTVTAQMVGNFLAGGAAINVLARQLGASVLVVNAGVATALPDHPALVNSPVAAGTADFTRGPAMTAREASAAVSLGVGVAASAIADGVDVLVLGEMGIGNSTAASAIIAAITGRPAAAVTGRGTGLDDAALARKVALVDQALTLHTPAAEDTLAKVGGLEIGALAGLMLGAAAARRPVLVDGLICTAAALIAAQVAPRVVDYLLAGHVGAEPGHHVALAHLGLEPVLNLGLRLGEGTGAVLALPLVEAAMRTLQEMATFGEAGVSDRDAD